MTNIIIRNVDEYEVDDLLASIADDYGLLADEIEDGDFV